MTRIRAVGLALVAVFALSAVTSAAASANKPELEPKGKAFTLTFTAKGGAATLEKSGGFGNIKCTANTAKGTQTSAILDEVTITFTGCKSSVGGACKSNGAPKTEEIKTVLLESLVVYAPTAKEVGVVLAPNGSGLSTGEDIFTKKAFTPVIECGGLVPVKVEVRNGVIGKIPNAELNAFKQTLVLDFTSPAVGTQTIEEYEKDAGCLVKAVHLEANENGGAFAAADEKATATLEEFRHIGALEEVKINA
jgi:hypothetical protein